jgi:hypothetical protein
MVEEVLVAKDFGHVISNLLAISLSIINFFDD